MKIEDSYYPDNKESNPYQNILKVNSRNNLKIMQSKTVVDAEHNKNHLRKHVMIKSERVLPPIK
jgi:hypothetical protein